MRRICRCWRLLLNIIKNRRIIRRKNKRSCIADNMLIREISFMKNNIPGGEPLMHFKVSNL